MSKVFIMAGIAAFLVPVAAQARVTDADRTFLKNDVQGGRYELAIAKMAASKATNPAIRSYAQMVVRDHESANAALTKLVRQEGVTPPAGMTADDGKMLAKLQTMRGNTFDRAFIDEMNRINADDKKTSDKELASTDEQAIKANISHFASMDAKHLQMAKSLRSKV